MFTPPLARRLLALLGCLLLAPGAFSQAMVQLSFEDAPPAPKSAEQGRSPSMAPLRVELEVGALIKGEPRKVELSLQLAPGTTAADLTELVSKRFERAGFDVLAPTPDRRERATRGTLFVEDALYVHMRLLGSIHGTLTTSEGPPQSLRIRPPLAQAKAGRLVLQGTAKHPRKDELELLSLDADLQVGDHPAQISERLHTTAKAMSLLSERPGGDAWQPVRMVDGAVVQGLSISLSGGGDWRLELKLPAKPR